MYLKMRICGKTRGLPGYKGVILGAMLMVCGGVCHAGDVPPGGETYRVVLTVTSDLPSGNVPMDPTIDFTTIIRKAKLPGVLDPNSIRVINVATGQPVPFARNEDFAYGDRGRLEWVISDPKHRKFEIRFRTAAKRPPLQPQSYTPAVGVGDLLRCNAGPSRPITFYHCGTLADLTGDGRQDLVSCWNYAYRPGDPWAGLICYPGLGDSGASGFGDLIRPRYAKTPDAAKLHKFGGFGHHYESAALADFNEDGKIDVVYTVAHTNAAKFYLNTGRRDPGGTPIFTPSGSVRVSEWNACRAADLNGDGALDLVIDGQYIKNENPEGWPFKPAKKVALDAGRTPCFLDVDGDGRLDAVSKQCEPNLAGPQYTRIAWRKNLGGDPPRFGREQLARGIEADWCGMVHSATDAGRPGLLVQHNRYQSTSFYELMNTPGEEPRFERCYRAESPSAVLMLGDQGYPCMCDWDADGDIDLLVGGGYGWPRIVINEGTTRRPVYAEPKLILADGKPIRFNRNEILAPPKNWHDMGYPFPVYADWDGDGLPDLFCPNETNRIFWYKNIGTRQEPLFGKRRQILCDGFPDSPELRTLSAKRTVDPSRSNAKRYPYEKERPFMWRVGAALADFNGDGLMDFVTCDGHTRVATLFAQYRDTDGKLRLRKDRALKLADGQPIKDRLVMGRREPAWTESFRAVDWDGDGLMDLIFSLCGAYHGGQDGGSIYLFRNCGTKADPEFENPVTMRCYGRPILITNHGPHAWAGDLDGDGKPDLLACVEWSVYPFYGHNALTMPERPKFTMTTVSGVAKTGQPNP